MRLGAIAEIGEADRFPVGVGQALDHRRQAGRDLAARLTGLVVVLEVGQGCEALAQRLIEGQLTEGRLAAPVVGDDVTSYLIGPGVEPVLLT